MRTKTNVPSEPPLGSREKVELRTNENKNDTEVKK